MVLQVLAIHLDVHSDLICLENPLTNSRPLIPVLPKPIFFPHSESDGIPQRLPSHRRLITRFLHRHGKLSCRHRSFAKNIGHYSVQCRHVTRRRQD